MKIFIFEINNFNIKYFGIIIAVNIGNNNIFKDFVINRYNL